MIYDVAGVIHQAPTKKLSGREQRIYDFFHTHPVGVVSLLSEDGTPYGTVVYYSMGKNFTASFVTKSNTRKYASLKHHPRVGLVAFDAKTQTVGSVAGTALEVTDEQEITAIARATVQSGLHTSKSGIIPLAKLGASPFVAFTIKPAQVRLVSYASPLADGHSEQLEPNTTQ